MRKNSCIRLVSAAQRSSYKIQKSQNQPYPSKTSASHAHGRLRIDQRTNCQSVENKLSDIDGTLCCLAERRNGVLQSASRQGIIPECYWRQFGSPNLLAQMPSWMAGCQL